MLLQGEVKDKGYAELPRQQEALYAHSSDVFMKADAQTGKHYYDLNAANKSYSGPWLFGKEHVQVFVRNLKAQWMQWCPIPADLRDGVPVRGNVIYEDSDGRNRMSNDMFEGVVRTEHGGRYFLGQTQHTFYDREFPSGQFRVVADLRIFLNQRLPYNPMMFGTNQNQAPATYAQQPAYESQPAYSQYSQQPHEQHPSYSQQPAYSEQPAQQPSYTQQPYSQQPSYSPPPSRFQPTYTQPTAPQNQPSDGGF